jgi:hypothetical protein
VVNLKWHDAVAVAAAQFKTKAEREAGWPQTMTIEQLAALQRPYLHKTEPGYKASLTKTQAMGNFIVQECEKGAIQWSTETRQTPHQITRMVPGDARFATRNVYGEREVNFRQQLVWASKDVQVKVITAPAFATWLAAQGEAPSKHIAAWFEAVGVNTQPDAAPAPTATPLLKQPTIWTEPRKREARTMLEKLKGEGKHDFHRQTAEYYQVSPQRLRKVLRDSAVPAPKKARGQNSVFDVQPSKVHRIK